MDIRPSVAADAATLGWMIKIPLGFSRIWIYGFGVAGGVNDDDALALFELGDDVVAVNRREQQHGDGEEEPKPRQPVTLGQKTGGIVRPADANFLTDTTRPSEITANAAGKTASGRSNNLSEYNCPLKLLARSWRFPKLALSAKACFPQRNRQQLTARTAMSCFRSWRFASSVAPASRSGCFRL